MIGAGCGDDANKCGEGTFSENGECKPTGGDPMCANGTKLNEQTHQCEIDPASCQDGTVLIDNVCQDPTAGLIVDVTEAAEPNGLGFIEDSASPAGVLALKAEGMALVVKGTINPHQDADSDGQADPDYDMYVLSVDEPTLLEVSADGLNGLMAAFIAFANPDDPNDPAASWLRYGLNVTGDTSKRQLYLPSPGTYLFAVGDTRSMYIDSGSPPAAGAGGAAGGETAEYFVSIKKIAIPAPTSLTLTSGAATETGTIGLAETKFFTATMGDGFNSATLTMPNFAAEGSLLVTQNGALRDLSDEADGSSAALAGFAPTDTAVIVVDYIYAYGPDPEQYVLEVRTNDASALCSTDCSSSPVMASQTLLSNDPLTDTGIDLTAFNTFYYDVAADDDIHGIDLEWNVPVEGVVLDADGFIFANFSFEPGVGFGAEWTEYRGLLRHPTAGRYYFLVYDANGTVGTDMITATTQMAVRTTTAITQGTPSAAQTVDAFESNAFTYAPTATDAWQQFDAVGTNTGDIELRFFDPASAYGRLDVLDAANPVVEDVEPMFTREFPEAGEPQGRVTLSDDVPSYLVTANTADTAGSPTFTLDFERRDHHDFGTVNSGTMTVNSTIDDTTNSFRLFLVRAPRGSEVEITAEPTTGDLDAAIEILDDDEFGVDGVDDNGAGDAESYEFRLGSEGYVAFVVYGTVTGSSDIEVSVTVTPPYYGVSNGTTVYADACTGGNVIPLDSGDTDDGLTDTIAAPANFLYYGNAVTNLIISTNGWLTFGSASGPIFNNGIGFPNPASDAQVAAYWNDLANVQICTKTVGDKLVIQWTGIELSLLGGPGIEVQAILDPADDSIEFVYGPNHVATGTGATIGVQDENGNDSTVISHNQPFTPASKKLTH